MDIEIKIGWYIEIQNCNQKLTLMQVQCDDLVHNGAQFPCYADCQSIGVASNFDAILGLKLVKGGEYSSVITEWDAYFSPKDFADALFNTAGYEVQDEYEVEVNHADPKIQWLYVCVEAWNADIWMMPPNETGAVGQLTITVRPTDEVVGID